MRPDQNEREKMKREVQEAFRPIFKVLAVAILLALLAACALLIYFLRLAGGIWGGE
jgi:hypothetical protein